MSGDPRDSEELNALRREVVVLRARVAELQRAAARHEDTAVVSLAEREELLREAERIAHVGTWTFDLSSGRVTWSDELYRILGLEPGSITPSVETFFASVHEEDRLRAQETTERAIREGILPLVDCRIVRPDGSIRHTTHLSSMLFDAEGTTRRMVGGVLDRTESLAAEATLRRTLGLLEEAQRFAKLANWRFDPRTGELEWSPEFCRICGIPEEARPTPQLFFERVAPEDRPRFEDGYQRSLVQPESGRTDTRIVRPDGEVRHVQLESFRVPNADGHVELRGTLLDVTEQIRIREELAHAQKIEAVGRLAAGIAHDFNNLLTVITGNLELLEERIGAAPELQDSRHALASASSLTARLLAFGRKAQLSLRLVDPNELVRSTIALMHRLVGDEVRLETQFGDGLPQVRVDPLEIERALVNLVVNARDAMPSGGSVRICTSAEDARTAQPKVLLSVEDSGPGIAPPERALIFEPFYTTRGKAGGTGLGLATVLGTAEQHGGSVRVEDRRGGGSVFTIVLPAASLQQSSDAPIAEGEGPRNVDRRLELLVIDDERMVADVTRRMLERRGHRVHVAIHPREALAVWADRSQDIDLVICDVVMAEQRGPELVARLAESGVQPRVLFITGYSEEAVRYELGHPVLSKPFTASALWTAINAILS